MKPPYWNRVWMHLREMKFGIHAFLPCTVVTLISAAVTTAPHWWLRLIPYPLLGALVLWIACVQAKLDR